MAMLPLQRSLVARLPQARPGVLRYLTGSAPSFAQGGPRLTEEQIEEISKYDAVLAQQMRTARQHNLTMSWKDLEDIPVHQVPHYWPAEGGPPRPLAEGGTPKVEKQQLSIAEGAKADAKKLWQAMKDKMEVFKGKK
eukprot:TRINITY_DN81884_c0_g1_i1.p2 TRINITY_DN81884_c0_g1~~TRINITY_DN81884_c0_g1_i1.p2  ORF type:complete len:150 (+),score=44.84 TRINITY_DN81884_c0_g1_i1:41-451(+)